MRRRSRSCRPLRPLGALLWHLDCAGKCRLADEPAQWGHLAVTGLLMQAGYLGGVWSAVKAGIGPAPSPCSSACSRC
jgi:hypothetical protein